MKKKKRHLNTPFSRLLSAMEEFTTINYDGDNYTMHKIYYVDKVCN